MSRYILNPNIALRSWRLVPYAYYTRGVRDAKGLQKDEFELLLRCDGTEELDDSSPLVRELAGRGFIRPAADGKTLSDWQEYQLCDNRYFPSMNWMITGKCNYNCRHCFNASDNAPLMSEWTLEEAKDLIRQARECGINAVTITGGEPMLHPNFFEIFEEIHRQGLYVNELNTNGSFIDQAALDRLKAIGCHPTIKISFDGLGHHDWMRNHRGAEERALAALRLCVENGFPVWSQTNVHRLNVQTMLPTAELLDEMGVSEMRIIRTTEAPRWKENAGDACLTLEEYFEEMLKFTEVYLRKSRQMNVDVWQFLTLFPRHTAYRMRPVECGEGKFRESLPVCRGNRGMIAIGADGQVYPCMQMSGYYNGHRMDLGNVKRRGLRPLLREGDYLSEVCTTVGRLSEVNGQCRDCPYFRYCAGGCRALALALTDDKMGVDPTKCFFFQNGYHRKIARLMDGWNNIAPMDGLR